MRESRILGSLTVNLHPGSVTVITRGEHTGTEWLTFCDEDGHELVTIFLMDQLLEALRAAIMPPAEYPVATAPPAIGIYARTCGCDAGADVICEAHRRSEGSQP